MQFSRNNYESMIRIASESPARLLDKIGSYF